MKNKAQTRKPVYQAIGIIIAIIIVADIAFNIYYNIYSEGVSLTQEKLAQFGDFVGGTLNPLLGFFTVGLLVWSIQIQMRELRLTREEISLVRAESELSREAMEAQVLHFEKEAKLNEINRLLVDVINSYWEITNEPAPSQFHVKTIFGMAGATQRVMTFRNVIEGKYKGKLITEDARNELRSYVQENLVYWSHIEAVIKTWRGLYLSYCRINDSSAFKTTKGIEWFTEASFVNDILNNEGIQKEIDNFRSESGIKFTNPR